MITLCYKQISGLYIHLDAYPPQTPPPKSPGTARGVVEPVKLAPAIVFFHGGGLTVGNRRSWFPHWMHKRFTQQGYIFISADYRLIPPSSGHDIVEDIRDLWTFLVNPKLALRFPQSIHDEDMAFGCVGLHSESMDSEEYRIDLEALVVAGVSAGGLCAYLCAMHCVSPRPKAVVSLYGMGGNFVTPHYLTPKTEPFFRGRELLDPRDPSLIPFVYEPHGSERPISVVEPTSDSALVYHPQTHLKPGYPANPRMLLARLYLQLGTFLDYYTGQHKPSLSEALRSRAVPFSNDGDGRTPSANEDPKEKLLRELVPQLHQELFPQLQLSSPRDDDVQEWPPTILVHGTDDSAVPIAESRHLHSLLSKNRAATSTLTSERPVDVLIEVPGEEHSFDLQPDAEGKWGSIFDEVVDFVQEAISRRCSDHGLHPTSNDLRVS